ncbi:MAG: CoB--CoM heterodisulfide reductase iron-sulfur subunit A family protein, partial [Anaerolineales bacterium]
MSEHEKEKDIRIGVYTCYCGGNISECVCCEDVREALAKIPNVVVSRTDMSMCSDAGQQMIEEDIREHGVNRVVIGACAPSLHEQTFRKTVTRAGLNPYLYHHVGLREQDSWVHHGDPCATEKAITLMHAGISKARLMEPLEPIQLGAQKHALVIGGGVAGLRSALDIARQGIQVTLIEKTPFLGGRMSRLEKVFPTEQHARESLGKLIEQVVAHPGIEVFTNAELTGITGYLGDFHATIRQTPRGVEAGYQATQAVYQSCPVEVPDEFNYGLTTRKAIYKPYPESYPAEPAIDWEHCTLCGECVKANGSGIQLEAQPATLERHIGAVVVATGFKPYEPREGEYGYGVIPEVVTLPQMIRLMALQKDGKALTYNGHPVKSIGLVHCVGSRHIPGVTEPLEDGKVNDYCSRYCCTATLHLANEIRERYPDAHIYDFYEDIRTYGRGHEEYYTQASKNLVRFMRFHADDLPDVNAGEAPDDAPVLVQVRDHLTNGL